MIMRQVLPRRLRPVLLAVIAAAMITGCTHPAAVPRRTVSASPSARPSERFGLSPHPFPRDLPVGDPRGLSAAQRRVDRSSPDAVATAFVVRLELLDTRLDRRPNDASRRAAAYATADLRRRMLAAEPIGSPGARWTGLVAHHGWTTVSTRSGGVGADPPTTATAAVRAVTPVPVDHGTDGWTSYPDSPGTYIVALHRTGEGHSWAVSSYTIQ